RPRWCACSTASAGTARTWAARSRPAPSSRWRCCGASPVSTATIGCTRSKCCDRPDAALRKWGMPPNQLVTPELRQWIVAQAQAGHKPEEVLAAMRASGWNEDIAIAAMEETLQGFLAEHAKAQGLPPPVPVPDADIGDSPVWLDGGDRQVQVLMVMRHPRV